MLAGTSIIRRIALQEASTPSAELQTFRRAPFPGTCWNKNSWFSGVAFPAFATNRQIIWKKTNRTAYATKSVPIWLAALSPGLALAVFATTALHVRLALGYWPMDAIDRSPTVSLDLHQFIFAVVFFFGIFAAVPIWLLLLCFRPLRLDMLSHLVQASVLVVGWLVLIWGPMMVPPKYIAWFLD